MTSDQLRSLQGPLKARYREAPESARYTMRATGRLDYEALACHVDSSSGPVAAGLHPMAGGDGNWACSGDMLLQALVACAGVTLCAVATSLGITIQAGDILAEGDIDFRGTLGVSRETPTGLTNIRLKVRLDSTASLQEKAKLLELTERYCVILRTLKEPPEIKVDAI